MKLQLLEGLGVEDEVSRPTVALSLAGRAGLPVLMIAGGKGRGTARGGAEVPEMELELMALPRSDARERDDVQVLLLLHVYALQRLFRFHCRSSTGTMKTRSLTIYPTIGHKIQVQVGHPYNKSLHWSSPLTWVLFLLPLPLHVSFVCARVAWCGGLCK